jgi:hypothetical protein
MIICIEGQQFDLPDNLADAVNDDQAIRALLTPYFPMAATAVIDRSGSMIELQKQPGRLGADPMQELDCAPHFVPRIIGASLDDLPIEELEGIIQETEQVLSETQQILQFIEKTKAHHVPFQVFI